MLADIARCLKNILLSRMSRVGCRFESNCPLVGPGTIGGIPSVGVFLRDPIPYLRKFGENHGKLRTARLTSATGL